MAIQNYYGFFPFLIGTVGYENISQPWFVIRTTCRVGAAEKHSVGTLLKFQYQACKVIFAVYLQHDICDGISGSFANILSVDSNDSITLPEPGSRSRRSGSDTSHAHWIVSNYTETKPFRVPPNQNLQQIRQFSILIIIIYTADSSTTDAHVPTKDARHVEAILVLQCPLYQVIVFRAHLDFWASSAALNQNQEASSEAELAQLSATLASNQTC